MHKIEQAITEHCGTDERAHVFSHLSHVYTQGSSIYTTYVFRNSETYQASLQRWNAMKQAASDAVTGMGGTISHQHGVGRDHARWLPIEKGKLGMASIGQVINYFDEQQLLNKGCLGDFTSLR